MGLPTIFVVVRAACHFNSQCCVFACLRSNCVLCLELSVSVNCLFVIALSVFSNVYLRHLNLIVVIGIL